MDMNNINSYRVGFWSAIMALFLVFVYSSLQALLGMNMVSNIKESIWIFVPPLVLAPTFMVVVLSSHYSVSKENKIWTSIGVSISTVYCGLIFLFYLMQFALPFEEVKIRHFKPYEGLFDRDDFLMAMDALTYFFIGLATLFLALAFKNNKILSRSLIWIAILVPFVLLSFFYPIIYFVGIVWYISFMMGMLQISFFFRNST